MQNIYAEMPHVWHCNPSKTAFSSQIIIYTRHDTLAIVPCCHQSCTFENFFGKNSLLKYGIDHRTFNSLCKASSWAVSSGVEQYTKDLFILGKKNTAFMQNACLI